MATVILRNLRQEDFDAVTAIWLEGNLDAHSFIPTDYWQRNMPAVRTAIADAEVI